MNLSIIEFTAPQIGGIASFIYEIVKACSSVAVGVVIFTLILKLITMPFDYASRASMRKNSVKMEQMRPELEKLQRQYADNKELYNQKMLALYKKNGYSMFGACLPTILTLVIFIVAINAFTDYSKFQNQQYFYNMTNSYNNVVYAGFELPEDNTEYIYRNEKGEFIVNIDAVKQADNDNDNRVEVGEGENQVVIIYSQEENIFSLRTEKGYSIYHKDISNNTKPTYTLYEENIINDTVNEKLKTAENNSLEINIGDEENENFITFKEAKELDEEKWTASAFIEDIRQQMAADTYRNEQQSFFWVKNIWATDSTTAHPIQSDWNTFKTTHGYQGTDLGSDGSYEKLISKLQKEKTEPNGYFILIALTALSSLLMQVVSAKANQAQMELQTVDGQGAQTQKMMKWLMPAMMAFFAFMYTAAFSIYIIMSSVISVATTFLINFIVDKQLKKEQAKKPTDKVYGKIKVQKEQPKKVSEKKEQKKQDKNDRFYHQNGGDFLSGKVDKKSNRK